MRVSRRVRPSQVGCGATVARRRLYAAVASAAETRASIPPAPRLALIIEPDGEIIATGEMAGSGDARAYDPARELVSSSANGL